MTASSPRPSRAFVRAFLIGLFAITLGSELFARLWIWGHPPPRPGAIVTVDAPFDRWPYRVRGNIMGPHAPKTTFAVRQYEGNGKFIRASKVHANNLGWVSLFDYPAQKAPGEFRVAFLGDSLTASINNDIPWVSVAQRELQASVDRRVLLMNLGSPGMGAQSMAAITLPIARRLGADLVVVNMTIEGLGFAAITFSEASGEEPPPPQPTSIRDALIHFNCTRDTPLAPCTFSPMWLVPAGRQLDRDDVLAVLREARKVASWKAVRAPELLVFSSPTEAMRDHFSSVGAVSTDVPREQEERAIGALQEMRQSYPNLIVTINPLAWYYDPSRTPPQLETFTSRARAAGLNVIDMRERMPPPPKDIDSAWYNLPHDGHWSDAGAELYGRAMARLLMDQVRELAGRPAQASN